MKALDQKKTGLFEDVQRYNIYTSVHKGLRGFMIDTVTRLGKVDVADACEFATVTDQVGSLLETCRNHIKHENIFLHPVLERSESRSSLRTRDEHDDHLRAIDILEHQLGHLIAVDQAGRDFMTRSLYLNLTRFVAENFEHMAIEETDNHEVLIAACSDAELLTIEGAIVASMTPDENMLMLRWMLGYMNTEERAFALNGMKQGVPAEVFQGVLEMARNTLPQREYFKLEKALA